MKVSELIEILQEEDQNEEVYFACDYGDHSHTQQALPVVRVSTEYLVDSAYSRSGKALYEPENDGDDSDEAEEDELDHPTALVLQ